MLRLAVIASLIIGFMMGCSGNYGKIRYQTGTEDKITLAELKDNWDEYDTYYSRSSNRWAAAIMFDPKNNGTKLTGDSWIKIKNQEVLSVSIREIQLYYRNARVKIIEGPDNHVFGYMYTSYLQIPVSVVDERTLYVGSPQDFASAPYYNRHGVE